MDDPVRQQRQNLIEGRGGNDYPIGYGGSDTLLAAMATTPCRSTTAARRWASPSTNWRRGADRRRRELQQTFRPPRGLVGDDSAGANEISITDFVHGARSCWSIGGGTEARRCQDPDRWRRRHPASLRTSRRRQRVHRRASADRVVFAGNTYPGAGPRRDAAFNAGADWAVKIVGEPTLTSAT